MQALSAGRVPLVLAGELVEGLEVAGCLVEVACSKG